MVKLRYSQTSNLITFAPQCAVILNVNWLIDSLNGYLTRYKPKFETNRPCALALEIWSTYLTIQYILETVPNFIRQIYEY